MKKTAELLVSLRKKNGYTQNDLANKLGVTSQAVSKWERGENLPDSMILLEIAKLYNISIEEILEGHLNNVSGKEVTKENFLIFVSSFLIILSIFPLILFWDINKPVAIMTTAVIASIGVLMLLYVGLKEEQH